MEIITVTLKIQNNNSLQQMKSAWLIRVHLLSAYIVTVLLCPFDQGIPRAVIQQSQ